jgi:hypothetical protein
MTSGFTASNATGTSFNLNLTGPITLGATSSSLTNNLVSGAALTLGDAGSPSTLSLGSTLTIQTQTAGGGLTTINDAVTGTGGLNVQNDAVVQLNNANNNYAGTTTVTGTGSPKLLVNGAKTGSGAVLVDTGGTLGGIGSITGDVGSIGTIAPGQGIGTLSVTGNVTMSDNSTLAIELGSGTSSDLLAITGNLDLQSTLDTLALSGSGTGPWIIATYTGTRTDTFNNVTGLPSGFAVNYDTPNQIRVIAAAVAGDWNGDTKVNAADYVTWRKDETGFGGAEGGNPSGYVKWRENFDQAGASGSSLSGPAAVPEPTTIGMLMFAVAAMAVWRRAR